MKNIERVREKLVQAEFFLRDARHALREAADAMNTDVPQTLVLNVINDVANLTRGIVMVLNHPDYQPPPEPQEAECPPAS